MKPVLKKLSLWSAVSAGILACGSLMVLAAAYLYLAPQLPSAETYKNVQLEAPLRIFTAERRLIAEMGNRRNPLTYEQMPDTVRNAVIANEDPGFYFHSGVDLRGLLRGFYGFITGENLGGGSTITMQLAKLVSFTEDNVYLRTFKKIPFALQIQRELTKEEILTLYLNLVHFGIGSDGIGAAAGLYYGKPASELSIAEAAMMASLMPNPANFNPINNPSLAVSRRNGVLQKMYEEDMISESELQAALATPNNARRHYLGVEIPAAYVAEMVRQQLYDQYGEDTYSKGFEVITSIDGDKQLAANNALTEGLEEYYDRPHGYRGASANYPPDNVDPVGAWLELLQPVSEYGNQLPGIVTAVQERSIEVLLKDGTNINIDWEGIRWARPYISQNNAWPPPESAADVAQIGDLVRVKLQDSAWILGQVPDIQAALVSVGTDSGEIQALVGGYDFRLSQVNRVLTSRPPGSNFKPFLYAAALENGYTPASTINDAPLSRGSYRPSNYDNVFVGPVTLRNALKDSRNVPAVRLYDQLTSDVVLPFAARFGFKTENFPANDLTVALGSQDVSPLDMAIAYSVFANGGYKVEPWLISEIRNLSDGVIFRANPVRVCDPCHQISEGSEITSPPAPRVLDARVAFIMNSMLRSVIEEGSGRRVQRELGRNDLMGKTGTTNGPTELWFSGFNREIATSVYVGFDQPKPLGESEQGATVAVPIWIEYMGTALAGTPERTMLRPDGLVDRLIERDSGKPAQPGEPNTMFEFFRAEDAPALPDRQNPSANNEAAAEEPVSIEILF